MKGLLLLFVFVSHCVSWGLALSETSSFLHRRNENGEIDTTYIELLQSEEHLSATISAQPFELCSAAGNITVSWSGVANPSRKDWIAIYSPSTSPVEQYLDYMYVDADPNYRTGSGSLNFYVVNMRTDYLFRYILENNTVVAVSNMVDSCSIPLQAHLSFTGDPSQIRIMWVSDSNDLPEVGYGTDPNQLASLKAGVSHTYTAESMCGFPANVTHPRYFRDPGFIHDVVMDQLSPSTVYYYQFGNNVSRSEIYSFKSAIASSLISNFCFAVYGDMGDGYLVPPAIQTATRITQHLEELDFVLHIGDISYARGNAFAWEWFFHYIQPIATKIPYMVGIGNHEYDHLTISKSDPSHVSGNGWHPLWGNYGEDSSGECGRPTFERFHMVDNGNSLFWYSFDYGNAHILHMSTEHNFTQGSPQYEWMIQDLESVDRSKTPWLIFAGHRPMYTSEDYPDDYRVSIFMQLLFEELLYKYRVDIALWGHYHAYERTCAVYKQQCRDDGIVHIVVGTAGASLDDADWMKKPWSINHANEFGYGLINITTDASSMSTSLLWKFVLNSNDTVFDQVVLTKSLELY